MNETHTTLQAGILTHTHYLRWRSVSSAARFYARQPDTIREWCRNGTFAAFSVPVWKDARGHWWVLIFGDERGFDGTLL